MQAPFREQHDRRRGIGHRARHATGRWKERKRNGERFVVPPRRDRPDHDGHHGAGREHERERTVAGRPQRRSRGSARMRASWRRRYRGPRTPRIRRAAEPNSPARRRRFPRAGRRQRRGRLVAPSVRNTTERSHQWTSRSAPRLGAACGRCSRSSSSSPPATAARPTPRHARSQGSPRSRSFLPFLAYVVSLLRKGRTAGSPPAALAGGLTGISLKIVSVVPELAIHRARSRAERSCTRHSGDRSVGATVIASIRWPSSAPPRRSSPCEPECCRAGSEAGPPSPQSRSSSTADSSNASFVPALLLFIAWTLAASLYLLHAPVRRSSAAARS